MLERRRRDRRRVCLGATMTTSLAGPPITVRLRNLNEKGAEVVVPGGTIDAEEVEIKLPNEDRVRRARVVWRRLDHFGLKFLSLYEEAKEDEAFETLSLRMSD
ncbi:PilZ domain-containing protein [Consotaella salsifontis]|uniref:PilZ domain-containing protein n=1 Tax=Consotaella salsifontis TaxID=1365950 RepID=A0A1T4RXL4_9HYPH|nr:PilZ domain-containing protein [Consotaella salsifontis]SKA20657.1 PilZ domain-containing protein [Consotaella salsifontis]